LPDDPQDYSKELAEATAIHSFVVHLWEEEAASPEKQAIWRGHITSIPNGKRHYFSDLKEVCVFIAEELSG
jgi:hypothetical protein